MRRQLTRRLVWGGGLLLISVLLLLFFLGGCTGQAGQQGPPGTAGTPGASTGIVAGKVTNSLTTGGISGVAITTDPAIKNVTITTDSSGAYSAELPIGVYTVTYKKTSFGDATQTVSVVAAQTITRDVAMKPTTAVVVSAGTAQSVAPDSTVKLSATATPMDGSTVTGYEWAQTAGIQAQIDDTKSASINVRLAKSNAYKFELTQGIEDIQRVKGVGINPHALSAAQTTTFKVTVTTSSGKYSATVNVTATLPYDISTGLQDVAKGTSVMVQGKTQDKYDWALTAAPADSKAILTDATTRYPIFTPDTVGKYTLTEKTTKATLDVYAGTWAGAISGIDAKGNPVSAGCTICHDGKTASNNFADWAQSGHSKIFTKNIDNPAGHWTASCASCHTVGYDTTATNNGFDEQMAKEGWKVPSHGEVGYWKTMLTKYPLTASMANIQCENCHGPNDGTGLHANKTYDAARISLSADVCGSCHGEPPRHGRFQQFEDSPHSNYQLAIDESGSASCVRCHTAQGFLTWLAQGVQYGDLNRSIQGKNGNATAAELALIVTADNAQPQTCAVCHDPHNPGTASGNPGVNTATVRVMGDTALLPSGYQAKNVGKGAVCITCHNTRNGAKADNIAITSFQAPHTPSQGDILMGENAFFVTTPDRSPHASLTDTCVTCHVEKTPPPAEFSYNGGGTNHTFKASVEICADCHNEALNGEAFKAGNEAKLLKLQQTIAAYVLGKLPTSFSVQDYTAHSFAGKNYDMLSDITVISKDNIATIELTEPHGQQGYLITFKTPVTFNYAPTTGEAPHKMTLPATTVRLGNLTTNGTTTVFAFTDTIVKANWNYFLVHGDASGGIHNPAFVNAILDATIQALK